MKIIYKRISILLVAILISGLLSVVGCAAEAKVQAQSLNAGQSDVLVPVKISSKASLMGFKITVSYVPDQVEITGVSRGSVTTNGNFSTNYGVNDGRFDIIWNNTSEVKADGTLFVLTVDTTKATKDSEIKITYSQPDTFDESYNDVKLTCTNIKVSKKAEPTTKEETTTEKPPVKNEEESFVTYNNSQVADAVNNVLKKQGIKTIYDVTDKQAFVDQVNKNLQIMLDTDQVFFDNYNSILKAYEANYTDGFVSDIVVKVDSQEIQNAIDDALKDVGVKKIDKVKDKKKFVEAVEKNIQKLLPDATKISDHIDEEKAFETVERLYNTSSQTNDVFYGDGAAEKQASENTGLIIGVSLLAVAVVGTVTIILIKKRKRNK